jgi:hypothetical protein
MSQDKRPMERFKDFVSEVLTVKKEDIQDMEPEAIEPCDPLEPEE